MSSFKDLRIVDNFYQTSAFFPMPTVMIGTLDDNGKTTFGPYSLVQPYYIAGKDYYAMLLCCTEFLEYGAEYFEAQKMHDQFY